MNPPRKVAFSFVIPPYPVRSNPSSIGLLVSSEVSYVHPNRAFRPYRRNPHAMPPSMRSTPICHNRAAYHFATHPCRCPGGHAVGLGHAFLHDPSCQCIVVALWCVCRFRAGGPRQNYRGTGHVRSLENLVLKTNPRAITLHKSPSGDPHRNCRTKLCRIRAVLHSHSVGRCSGPLRLTRGL